MKTDHKKKDQHKKYKRDQRISRSECIEQHKLERETRPILTCGHNPRFLRDWVSSITLSFVNPTKIADF